MKIFTMSAVCSPSKNEKWFPGFQEGLEFQADDLEQAQDWINAQCQANGTDEDPEYLDNGPIADELPGD